VVHQHPRAEHGVEVGLVDQQRPLALAQRQSVEQHHRRLLACRQRERPHAALVMIERVVTRLVVQKGRAIEDAVEEDRLLRVTLAPCLVDFQPAHDAQPDVRRVAADQRGMPVALDDATAPAGIFRRPLAAADFVGGGRLHFCNLG